MLFAPPIVRAESLDTLSPTLRYDKLCYITLYNGVTMPLPTDAGPPLGAIDESGVSIPKEFWKTMILSEIVAALNPRSAREADLWMRRVRYWAAQGILQPIGDLHTGTGNHRNFEPTVIYVVQRLMCLADARVGLSVLVSFAQSIRQSAEADLVAQQAVMS
jgi:hypothetical protein